ERKYWSNSQPRLVLILKTQTLLLATESQRHREIDLGTGTTQNWKLEIRNPEVSPSSFQFPVCPIFLISAAPCLCGCVAFHTSTTRATRTAGMARISFKTSAGTRSST